MTFGELCQWTEMMVGYTYFYRFPVNGRDCILVHAGFCEDLSLISDQYESLEELYLCTREAGFRLGGVKNGLVIAGYTPTIAEKTECYTDGEVFRYHDEEKDCIFYDIDCVCACYERFLSGTMACLRLEDEKELTCNSCRGGGQKLI